MRCPVINRDRQQCRLDHPHEGVGHDFKPRIGAPLTGRVTSASRCPGCGTSTDPTPAWPRGAPCSVCAQNPRFQAPAATMAIGAQPEPAYQRRDYSGNFPPPGREPDDKPLPGGDE